MLVRTIRWSIRAQKERAKIFLYWIERNGSDSYSRKLNNSIKELNQSIVKNPEMGRLTDKPNIRYRILKTYQIFYRISENYIDVITIWDMRRNPKDLKL